MKKILLMLSIIIMMILCNWAIVSAEEVEGLSEALDKIIMDRNFTQEQFDEMDEEYIKDFDYRFWDHMLKQLKMLGRMHTNSDEEEYEYCLNRDRPDYAYGLLMSKVSNKYAKQYTENGVLSYLFDNNGQYWVAMHKRGIGTAAAFALDGTRIYNYDVITITQEMIDFLKDKDNLQNMLLQKGEHKVDDIKIFYFNHLWTLMYIKCGSQEYGISLFYTNDSHTALKPKFEPYKLYKMSDIIDLDEEQAQETLGENYTPPPTKPVYTTEAQSLQEEGLLNGNENGLDLLKPLTRIEATAILVRAMGLEDTQTSATSYFADIQSDNWGAKYANIAKDKGITTGIGDDLFAPNDTITASQFATLILRNMGENPDWQTAINTFVERGFITSEQAEKMDLFTRGDMAKIIYETQQRGLLR